MFSQVITSHKAARVFEVSAWWTALASVTIGLLLIFPTANLGGDSVLGVLISLCLGIVGLIGGIASLLLWAGMLIHVAKVRNGSSFSTIIWIAFIVMILPVGEVIYYFAVYRHSTG